MKIYNTLTREIEKFIPINKDSVNMYTCGPTVYHNAHIGNLRCYIMEDILEKSLVYSGYKVNRVMNITDIGHLSSDSDTGVDKMVDGAIKEKKTVLEIAREYTDLFFEDCEKLNIKKPESIVTATSCVDKYIDFIERLINKGYAYISNDNVYFDTSKLDNYYVLTNNNEEDLIVGSRDTVSEDANKKNKADFVLWFTKSKFLDQELKWNSPWGVGYPGWHIECSAISLDNCGEYLDIHCGGVDNKFPHHTNEIAQCEAYLGHKWCNYWIHVEHLNDQSGKMSKSSGESLTLSLLESKGYSPMVYRLFCLASHYRKPLMFSYETLDNTKLTYDKLSARISNLDKVGKLDLSKFGIFKQRFIDALGDDLNTSFALTILYDVLKSNINDKTKYELVKSFDEVLSLNLIKEEDIVDDEIKALVDERNKAKNEKDYLKADEIRNIILDKGYQLIDSKDGIKIFKVGDKQ